MTSSIVWESVIYDEKDQRLCYMDQTTCRIPEPLVNLFCDRVAYLNLSGNKLSNLDALQYFSNMIECILDNNYISEEVNFPTNSKELRILSLNNNRIKRVDVLLQKLKHCFPNLEYLSLLGNTACPYFFSNTDFSSYFDYRLIELASCLKPYLNLYDFRIFVISNLQHLKFLDSRKITVMERKVANNLKNQEDTRRKSFNLSKYFSVSWMKREEEVYSPLPDTIREPGDHRGAYGKLSYKYIGAESEGNRFIFNHDL